jgi:2-polyprenyl-6-methoxyphenol hydroxylase-like FAD-dependent oxidoreductase
VRIACVGGGPAGLYFSLLVKLRNPDCDVTVFERNKEGATYGWGVTMEEKFLARLARLDPASAGEIAKAGVRWRDQVVNIHGARDVYREEGHAYGLSRQRFVDILASRACGLGVGIRYEQEVRDLAGLGDADLILAADGAGSRLRNTIGGFGTNLRLGSNKYIWLGTRKLFDSFNFYFSKTACGWIWAYAYKHDPVTSTFIVECPPATWTGLGFDQGSADDTLAALERIFAAQLDGHRLMGLFADGATAPWLNFRTVTNERWHKANIVLAGDSAHTIHYSVGLGTTTALEDVIALSEALQAHAGLNEALQSYEEQRKRELLLHATEGRRSASWFENVARYAHLEPDDFSTVLHSRRAPLLPVLPPRLFCQLSNARRRWATVDAARRTVSSVIDRARS